MKGLHDAKPEAWKEPKAPDPSPADLALKAAAVSFTAAKQDLDGVVGPETADKAIRLKAASLALAEAAVAFASEITR